MTKKKNPEDLLPDRRPTLYKPEYVDQAYKLALLGCTDAQMADVFDVATSTLYEWKKEYPEFSESIKRGKEIADGEVAASLFQRALGYSHKAVKIVADAKTGAEHIVEYVERYPPDTQAASLWLRNRQPDKWRDKQEVAQTINATVDANVTHEVPGLADRFDAFFAK